MERFPLVRIYTFKQGLLSALAHDLQLVLQRVELELDDGKIRSSFDLESLLVEGVVRSDGSLDPKKLSQSDYRKIRHTALHEILKVDRHPQAQFEGTVHEEATADRLRVEGALTLAGLRRAIPAMTVLPQAKGWVGTVEIQPSRWGIRPYRAMGGTLRLQDRVKIEVSLPKPEDVDWDWRKDALTLKS